MLLKTLFQEAAADLAIDSFEMRDILCSIVSIFHVYLMRLLDGGHYLPRAQVTLSLGGLVEGLEFESELRQFLTRTITLDLFEPPIREQIRPEVVKLTSEGVKQRDIAAQLGTHQATVQRALKLNRLLSEERLTNPYKLVSNPPEEIKERNFKRVMHPRYEFKLQDGYQPPGLQGF